MSYHRLTWRDAVEGGVIEEEEIEEARRVLPDTVLQVFYSALQPVARPPHSVRRLCAITLKTT
jgi:hypothetical protein